MRLSDLSPEARRIVLIAAILGLNALVAVIAWIISMTLGVVLLGIVLVDLTLGCVLLFPDLMVAEVDPSVSAGAKRTQLEQERLKLVNDVRGGLLQALGSAVLLVGILVTWHQLQEDRGQFKATQEQVRDQIQLSRQGLVTERFSRAVEQLGATSNTTEMKIGAIATLEQIAETSEPPQRPELAPIIRLLADFVRSVSRFEDDKPPPCPVAYPSCPLKVRMPELQAAMDALSRLNNPQKYSALPELKLTRAYLGRAQLSGANLSRAELDHANLSGSDLNGANLRYADLRSSNLQFVDLHKADLQSADLRGADLRGADLTDAQFDKAAEDSTTLWPASFDPGSNGIVTAETTTTVPESWDPASEIRIEEPMRGQAVSDYETVRGQYSDLPPEGSIWVLTKPASAADYYVPEQCDIVDDTEWECTSVILGQPGDTGEFTIIAVVANQAATKWLETSSELAIRSHYSTGVSALPSGLLGRHEITVSR